MTNEEVQVRLGVDSSGVNPALQRAEQSFKQFSHGVLHQMREIKHLIHGFGAIQVAEKIIEAGKQIGEFFGTLSQGGEDGMEQIKKMGESWGATGEMIRKAREQLEKFQEKMSETKENREYKNASYDEKRHLDSDEREKGIALKADNDSKINDLLKELKWAEHTPFRVGQIRDALKKELAARQKLSERAFKIEERSISTEEEWAKTHADDKKRAAEKQKQDEEKRHERHKQNAEKLEHLEREKLELIQRMLHVQSQQNQKQLSEYRPGLEDIANSRSWYSGDAKRLMAQQAYAKNQLTLYGNTEETQRQIKYAESLKEPLRKAGLLPESEDPTKEMAEHLREINNEGVKIREDESK